jgi:hypothetical protein
MVYPRRPRSSSIGLRFPEQGSAEHRLGANGRQRRPPERSATLSELSFTAGITCLNGFGEATLPQGNWSLALVGSYE